MTQSGMFLVSIFLFYVICLKCTSKWCLFLLTTIGWSSCHALDGFSISLHLFIICSHKVIFTVCLFLFSTFNKKWCRYKLNRYANFDTWLTNSIECTTIQPEWTKLSLLSVNKTDNQVENCTMENRFISTYLLYFRNCLSELTFFCCWVNGQIFSEIEWKTIQANLQSFPTAFDKHRIKWPRFQVSMDHQENVERIPNEVLTIWDKVLIFL